eukprot:CAMPEP_0173420020 /NCGR_PEP_ID=MMETSP1357-20121228/1660_1 /TAXON_ID=77926 /ORGANISM="Hemiselmis rufescens, Strain PCC563" /LENGTH=74 /DNA_ID=CAMNT_0014382763 /DNA_START=174 /DNA_END=398 /DNA_ORIENTATION=-
MISSPSGGNSWAINVRLISSQVQGSVNSTWTALVAGSAETLDTPESLPTSFWMDPEQWPHDMAGTFIAINVILS